MCFFRVGFVYFKVEVVATNFRDNTPIKHTTTNLTMLSFFLVLLISSVPLIAAFSSCQNARILTHSLRETSPLYATTTTKSSSKLSPCDPPAGETDRREVLFSTLGAVFASLAVRPSAADAAYGADANMEMPNVLEGITNRATKQCLVESLGNRECLLYMDPDNKLFEGFDNEVLLERLEKSSAALATIPGLIASKKWSAVNGVLTGPMGTLVSTMNELTKISKNGEKAAVLAKATKADIIAISQAAGRKQGDQALASHQKATEHLVAFVQSL